MKTFAASCALLCALTTVPVTAHESKQTTSTEATERPELNDVIAVADQFGVALKAGETATLARLLDENVLILESGGAERSRAEYLSHHAISDAAFLAKSTVKVDRRDGRVEGHIAWLATESSITTNDQPPKVLSSTETLVLRREANDWRIVHIHWSSRTAKETK